jgi:hypothetical protein
MSADLHREIPSREPEIGKWDLPGGFFYGIRKPASRRVKGPRQRPLG